MTQLKKLKGDKSEEINFTASKEPVVCSFCRKKGHVAANCYAKERQRKMDKFKRKGKTKRKRLRRVCSSQDQRIILVVISVEI